MITEDDVIRRREESLIWKAGSYVCHQRPERLFILFGRPMPLCQRCFPFFTTFFILLAFSPLILMRWHEFFENTVSFYISLLLILPVYIDLVFQHKLNRVSTPLRRGISGVVASFGVIIAVLRAVVWFAETFL